jgi:hypothetical protein
MPVRRLLPALLAVVLCCAVPPAAGAAPYLPAPGQTWNGVTAGDSIDAFTAEVGRPAVWQHFIQWNGAFDAAIDESKAAGTRLMLALGTSFGQDLPERFSPGELARGFGDEFLVALAERLAAEGRPVYLRLMGEMNNCHNPYAPTSCLGTPRDFDHSAVVLRQAWRRAWVIMRGGEGDAIDARLRRLGLPPLQVDGAVFPRAQVAFVWAPMTGGSPNIASLRPSVFWPGSRYVDWVGTSFYSRFPNFVGLSAYYRAFAVGLRKPFALAEWAMWGADDPRFVRRLFAWIAARPRVRMLQYNQGDLPDSPFRLDRYPAAMAAMRRALASPRFTAPPPETG